ncbi:hypothetical protein [Streptomyces griseoaurantiacus]|uniref:hypothetical protein n=1 Tax=Streptomyces griseoaurantiacus TaxID=68213 RepID=UPI00368ABAE2
MTTPTPPSGGQQGLTGALRQLTMQLQALLHQNQTLNNLPTSAANALRSARQGVASVTSPQALLGGQVPPPAAPNGQWLQQAAASFLSQAVMGQPRRSTQNVPPPPPPSSAQGPAPAQAPAQGGGMSPAMGYPYPFMWGNPYQGAGSSYNGPMPGIYPGPVVAPSHPGSGGGGGGGGAGSWVRSSLPKIGGAIAGPWGAVAGAAIALGSQVPAEVRSQRDKNAYYQSIEGGSNFDGFAERAHEEAYRWTTFGVLSSEESRKAFKGVTKLGYNSKVEGGPGRQDALNFIYHGKTRRGETVDESLQQLQVASKNALTNLNDLSNALNEVSDSAGKAGVNSQLARAEFTQLLDTAQKSGYGSSSIGVASAEQQIKNSYGRSFQDMDVSQRLSMSHTIMSASASGMSVSDYLTSGVTNKLAADSRLDKSTVQAVMKPGVEEWIKQKLSKAGGAGNVPEDTVQGIAEEMLRQFYPNDSFALPPVVSSLSGNKITDPVKAAAWIVQQFNEKGATAALTQNKADLKKTSAINQDISGLGKVFSPPQGIDQEVSGRTLGIFGGHASKAVQAYKKWADGKGGQYDPVVVNLLNKIKGDDKAKVAVSTKDGKRVVSLEEAIKNHRNELASGKAVIVEGDKAGKSVEEILGKDKVDPLRDFSKEAKKKDSSGESYAKWEKDHTKKDKKGRDKLEITLSPQAQRLLSVMDSTGVSGSSATATPPLSPYASNPSYSE